MAFLSRVSNLLKKNCVNNVTSRLSAANASLFQSIRLMSSSKLFVGGLSFSTDELSLKEAFAQYGEVVESRIVMDRDTGRSRGFGFVTYTSTEDASSAIQALDGQDMHGRRVRVSYATEKPRGGGFGGSFGGGGGYGYGGQGGGYQGGGYSSRGDNFGRSDDRFGGDNQYSRGGNNDRYGNSNELGDGDYGASNKAPHGDGEFGVNDSILGSFDFGSKKPLEDDNGRNKGMDFGN